MPFEELIPELVAVLTCYRDERQDEETFGDFWHRVRSEVLEAEKEALPSQEVPSQ